MGDAITPAKVKKPSLLDRLEAFFRARPGQWIDGRALEGVAGVYAWRTRVSELRTLRGMTTLENRQRKVTNAAGQTVTVSEYCFPRPTPAPEPVNLSLFEATGPETTITGGAGDGR